MTEEQIERIVESRMNRLDREFMRDNSTMTQEEYDKRVKELNVWAEAQFDEIR